MKPTILLLCAAWLLSPTLALASQNADATMFCLSLRFQHGSNEDGTYAMDLTTLSSGINGELFPSGGSFTHGSYLVVRDVLDTTFFGEIYLDVPDGGDANSDGFPDFYQVSQPISATSSGQWDLGPVGSGSVQATWYRAAGSPVGTCVLKFKYVAGFLWNTFTQPFEILEYKGTLSYVPGTNSVSGAVELTQTGTPDNLLGGPIRFVKSATSPTDSLVLQAGGWTNNYFQNLAFSAQDFERDVPAHATNYFGYIEFDDGDLNTPDPDYSYWLLSIDDSNDANHNGVPDLSDNPQPSEPRRPLLSLAQVSTNLSLTISGKVGHQCQVQEALSVSAPNWQTILSVTLTNDPQTVILPSSAASSRFWRVAAQ